MYLDRRGIAHPKVGGILLHKIGGPDPGRDLHDHPWTFWSLVLKGGYLEERQATDEAILLARTRFALPWVEARKRWSIRKMDLGDCHRIDVALPGTWTLLLIGPVRRGWGFYTANGYVPESDYKHGPDGRDLHAEIRPRGGA